MEVSNTKKRVLHLILGLLIVFLLSILSWTNFLLFHTLAELMTIVVAFSMGSILATLKKKSNRFYQFIGISYLLVGVVDLLHTLTYKGVSIVGAFPVNIPTQLWILGRYLEASLFIVGLIIYQKKNIYRYVPSTYVLLTTLCVILIFKTNLFPDCYIDGQGLTFFKIVSEYIIISMLIISLVIYNKKNVYFSQSQLKNFNAAIIMTIIQEVFFTLYIDVYGISNFIGHIFKMISYIFIYKVFVDAVINYPIDTLYAKLKAHTDTLQEEYNIQKNELDIAKVDYRKLYYEINHRVKNNLNTIISLIHFNQRTRECHNNNSVASCALPSIEEKIRGLLIIHSICSRNNYYRMNLSSLIDLVGRELITSQTSVQIPLCVKKENITISHDSLNYLAFIVNELFVNSLKYNNPESLTFDISVSIVNNEVEIIFQDNGKGYPKEIIENSNSWGTGLTIMQGFCHQSLNGTCRISNSKGATSKMQIPFSKDIQIEAGA